jgi:uncharacterized protein
VKKSAQIVILAALVALPVGGALWHFTQAAPQIADSTFDIDPPDSPVVDDMDIMQKINAGRHLIQTEGGDRQTAVTLLEEAWAKRSGVRRDAAFWLARAVRDEDPGRAIELLGFAEAAGRRGAAKELAVLLDRTSPGDSRIETLWRRAASEGDPWAGLVLAGRYGDVRALDLSIARFEELHAGGHTGAGIDLVRIYAPGGLRPDGPRHEHWLSEAAERSALGSLMLGEHLINGAETPGHVRLGLAWLERSIALGSSAAETVLGRLLLYGTAHVAADPERAAVLLHKAATAGNPTAMHAYSRALFNGLGMTSDPEQAAIWLERAAASGHQWAQAELAQRLLEGDQIAADPAAGRHWLERAAAQGHGAAHARLQAL